MRKNILAVMLVITAFIGVLSMGGAADAAVCHVTPNAPGPLAHGMALWNTVDCSDVDSIQFREWAFEGTPSNGGQVLPPSGDYTIGSDTMGAHGCYGPGSGYACSPFSWGNIVNPCPFGAAGLGPFWWGHQVSFRIHNHVAGTWGSWTGYGVASAGWYGTCFN